MNEGHKSIINFLQALRKVKGDRGRIILSIKQWDKRTVANTGFRVSMNRSNLMNCLEEISDTHHGQSNKRIYNCDNPSLDDYENNGVPKSSRDLFSNKWHGQLKAGQYISVNGFSPITGFLHMFNLGTSGTCSKLVPSGKESNNRVVKGEKFHFPSRKSHNVDKSDTYGFPVSLNKDSINIQPDRILVIVSKDDMPIQIHDLDPRLSDRCNNKAEGRGPGFGGKLEMFKSNILEKLNNWEYGLLEMEIICR